LGQGNVYPARAGLNQVKFSGLKDHRSVAKWCSLQNRTSAFDFTNPEGQGFIQNYETILYKGLL
jgi:hypothetical protein